MIIYNLFQIFKVESGELYVLLNSEWKQVMAYNYE